MAVANTKTTAISNSDASPRVLNNPAVTEGSVKSVVGSVEVAAADDNDSVYRMARVPSSAVILSLLRFNDAITGATDWNLGVYETAANGGAAVDDNLFADAVDINAGTVAGVEQRFTTANIDGAHKRLWELLGLSVDPQKDYDICWTAVAVGSAAGTVTMQALYST